MSMKEKKRTREIWLYIACHASTIISSILYSCEIESGVALIMVGYLFIYYIGTKEDTTKFQVFAHQCRCILTMLLLFFGYTSESVRITGRLAIISLAVWFLGFIILEKAEPVDECPYSKMVPLTKISDAMFNKLIDRSVRYPLDCSHCLRVDEKCAEYAMVGKCRAMDDHCSRYIIFYTDPLEFATSRVLLEHTLDLAQKRGDEFFMDKTVDMIIEDYIDEFNHGYYETVFKLREAMPECDVIAEIERSI